MGDGTIDVRLSGDTSDFDDKMERSGKKIKEAFSGGHESLGKMLTSMDSLAGKAGMALAALKALNEGASLLNERRNDIAERGGQAGGVYRSADFATQGLSGDTESYRQWATRADETNGITIANKTAFMANISSANRSRTDRGLNPFKQDEITRAQRLYERGGGQAFGENGAEITGAMGSDQGLLGLDNALRWRMRDRNGGTYRADMSAEDMADSLRKRGGGRAFQDARTSAYVDDRGFNANARNFDESTIERRVNAEVANRYAPGGKVGFNPGQIPVVGRMVGGLMEMSEKSQARDIINGDGLSAESWATSPSASIKALLTKQTSIMQQQAVPVPAIKRDGDR